MVVTIGVNVALRATAKRNVVILEPASIEANLNRIIGCAKRYGAVLVLEPTPVIPEFQHADGLEGTAVLEHLGIINNLLTSVCKIQDVALVGLTNELQTDPEYLTALQESDGLHPSAAGYDCIAEHLLACPAWSAFLEATAND